MTLKTICAAAILLSTYILSCNNHPTSKTIKYKNIFLTQEHRKNLKSIQVNYPNGTTTLFYDTDKPGLDQIVKYDKNNKEIDSAGNVLRFCKPNIKDGLGKPTCEVWNTKRKITPNEHTKYLEFQRAFRM